MFSAFFYELRECGVPVTPTTFLRLQQALSRGLIGSLDEFYTAARCILVKSERYFDLYDQVFAHHFGGIEMSDQMVFDLDAAARALLERWLHSPEEIAEALGISPEMLSQYSPEELLQYFLDRLREQTEAHHGGNRWIGTRGTSPWAIPAPTPEACAWEGFPATVAPSKWPWTAVTGITPRKAP